MEDIVKLFTQDLEKVKKYPNLKQYSNNLEKILLLLHISSICFKIKALSAREISTILKKKYNTNVTPQAVRSAALSKDGLLRISTTIQEKITSYSLMDRGISEAKKILGDIDISNTSETVIPHELVDNQNGYIKKVVYQINGCYDDKYFDACFVMIRRLIETLIIELFERKKIEANIKDNDGNYYMFKGLIGKLKSEPTFSLGRNSNAYLDKIKELGDIGAHSRRNNLKQHHIEKNCDSIAFIVEELINC